MAYRMAGGIGPGNVLPRNMLGGGQGGMQFRQGQWFERGKPVSGAEYQRRMLAAEPFGDQYDASIANIQAGNAARQNLQGAQAGLMNQAADLIRGGDLAGIMGRPQGGMGGPGPMPGRIDVGGMMQGPPGLSALREPPAAPGQPFLPRGGLAQPTPLGGFKGLGGEAPGMPQLQSLREFQPPGAPASMQTAANDAGGAVSPRGQEGGITEARANRGTIDRSDLRRRAAGQVLGGGVMSRLPPAMMDRLRASAAQFRRV